MEASADRTGPALPPALRRLTTSPSGAAWTVAVVGAQLAFSVRFFAKYAGALAPAAYVAYVAVGLGLCVLVLRSPRPLRLLTREPVLVAGVVCLLVLVAVVYPVADALRDVGAGSDQDDCVRTLVGNVVALRPPFGRGYFGDPCSTGPGELFVYWPVAVTWTWFVAVPALCVCLGYAVLRVVADRPVAVLLSLTQLCSWLFLELATTGSDLLVIGWLYAAAVTCSWVGVRERRVGLAVAGGAAYFLFATSRVPLALVAAVSAGLLLVTLGARASRVVAPAGAAAVLVYAGSYAVAPSRFEPGHLVAKSGRVVRDLAGGPGLPALIAVGLLVAAAGALAVRTPTAVLLRRHALPLHVAALAVPMGLVSLWDLLRRDLDPARWEGLHYVYLAMPVLLVTAADRIGRDARARVTFGSFAAGTTGPAWEHGAGRVAMWARDVRATTAGVLFIVATIAALVSSALLGSSLDGTGFLADVAHHQWRVLGAASFQLVAAFTSAAIAISLYPVLRRHAEGMALGSVGFRLVEGVFYAVAAVGTLVLVALADQAASTAGPHVALRASGDLVRDLRQAAGVAGVLAFYVGATLYYLVFYRSGLVPRWLSGWGLVGTALGFVGGLLVLFRVVDTLSGTQVALNVPIGVQELVLAVWLLWKGFRSVPGGEPGTDRSEPALRARA